MYNQIFKNLIPKAFAKLGGFEIDVLDYFDQNQKRFDSEFCILFAEIKCQILIVPVVLKGEILIQKDFADKSKFVSLRSVVRDKIKKEANSITLIAIEHGNFIEKFEDSILKMYEESKSINDFAVVLRQINNEMILVGVDIDNENRITELNRYSMKDYLSNLLRISL